MGRLERASAIATLIMTIIGVVSWVTDVPLSYKIAFGVGAIILLILSVAWPRIRKQQTKEPNKSSVIRLRETEDVTIEDVKGEGYNHIVDSERGKRTEIRSVEGRTSLEKEVSSKKNRRRDANHAEKD